MQMAKTIGICKVHSFSTSPNFCQCTAVWYTDAADCCI